MGPITLSGIGSEFKDGFGPAHTEPGLAFPAALLPLEAKHWELMDCHWLGSGLAPT